MKFRAGSFLKSGEFYLLLVVAGLAGFLTVFSRDFFSLENLFDVLTSYSFLGVMAAGLLVVLISGGIDISFTATATVAQYVMAVTIIRHGGSWWLAFLIPISIGISLGALNAVLVYYLRVHSIIITIATLNIFYGVLIFVTRGKWIYNFPDWFTRGWSLFDYAAGGKVYSFSLSITVLVAAVAVTAFILNKTAVGRRIYAMGGNMEAAKRIGFNLFALHLFVYCYM